jgi:hypothetical protein
MPFYRFEIDVNAPQPVVVERLRAIVRGKLSFGESFRQSFSLPFSQTEGAPFIGSVQDDSFKMRRNIRYRNSFLPMIRGTIGSYGVATRVSVTMFLHPAVAIFMIFWLGMVASVVVSRPTSSPISWGMLAFGIALPIAGFIPEAIKAKRLISEALSDPVIATLPQSASFGQWR